MGSGIGKLKKSMMLSFFAAFTYFGFGTFELYAGSYDELWFDYTDMFPVILLSGILTMGFFTVILMMLPDKFFKYGMALLFSFTLALYVQGNFLPNDYGVLDGTAIDWGKYSGRLWINSAFWIVLIIGFLIFAGKTTGRFYQAVKLITGIVLATQVVTMSAAGYMIFKHTDTGNNSLSVEGELEVSQKNNTIVFVLDCFDSGLFCELLEQDPVQIRENFKDFTFYHNMAGGATRTKYAIPYIFTGKTNTEKAAYSEYLKTGFSASPLLQQLQADPIDARIYTEAAYVDMTRTDAFDNITDDSLHATSAWGLTKDFFKLTAFRYAPHIMKQHFWMYSGDFDQWKKSTGEQDPYVIDDCGFYQKLCTEQLKASVDDDVFRFYHLNGAHAPYWMDENGERAKEQTDEYRQAYGALKIVSEYISQLKELGIYENTVIFIMADHGGRDYEQNPLFMVKERGLQQEFRQSEIPLSYQKLPDMMTDAVKIRKLDLEKKYRCQGERYFYVGQEENNNIRIFEYVIKGAAYDKDEIELTGNVFEGNTDAQTYQYRLGDLLSFTKDATANAYCRSGFSKNEATHTWTDGEEAEMCFELNGTYDDLLLDMDYGVYAPPQRVQVYVNGNEVTDFVASGDEHRSIRIPGALIKDGRMELRFAFPDAVSPKEKGESTDARKLALSMYGICISPADEQQ